jgi:SAM-dependent methyltransferase
MISIESQKYTPSIIRSIRNDSFVGNLVDYGESAGRGLREYDDRLPRFKGKKLSEIIADKIGQESTHDLKVLDIGCGTGNALEDIVEQFGVSAFGLSSFDYPTVEDKRFDCRVGDAQRLHLIYGQNAFDVIVSVYAFRHIADSLAVLKQAYKLSKKGGVILIDEFQLLTEQQANLLKTYWESYGIEAEFRRNYFEDLPLLPAVYGLALQRGENPHLPLPFKYDSKYRSFSYLMDEKTVRKRLGQSA